MGLIADEQPAIANLLHTSRLTHGKGMQSYLTMMAVRLLEMRRVLKPTGSIYLHCDPTASHYLKLLMDAVFGSGNFQNDITWKRSGGKSDAKRWGRVSDQILYYTKRGGSTWNRQYQPHDPEYVSKTYHFDDDDGRGPYTTMPLHADGTREGESGKAWGGYDPGKIGNHWRTPTQGIMAAYIVEHSLIPGWPDAFPGVHLRLQAIDDAGLIKWSQTGVPRLKTYLAATKGVAITDIIVDVPMASARERTGYPTQKPLALLERIIKASSNEGDVVLDPFCGCATACVAADRLGRKWVGIDISPKAVELVNMRLQRAMGSLFHHGYVTARTDIPRRTDVDAPKDYRQNKHVLFGRQEGLCAGCKVMFPFRNFTIDHVVPQSRGGTDHLDNLQLLCGACNSLKGRPAPGVPRSAAEGDRGVG